MKAFVNNLELIPTAAGLVVIFGATLLTPFTANPWAVAATTAIAVGILHGVVFWLVHRQQRTVTHIGNAVQEISGVLRHLSEESLRSWRGKYGRALPPR